MKKDELNLYVVGVEYRVNVLGDTSRRYVKSIHDAETPRFRRLFMTTNYDNATAYPKAVALKAMERLEYSQRQGRAGKFCAATHKGKIFIEAVPTIKA